MKIKLLISIIAIMVSFSSYGQSNYRKILKDSTKIKIIGNSVYRVYTEKYKNKNLLGWNSIDSTSIRYSKINLSNVYFKRSKPEILLESFDKLDDVLALLKNNPKTKLQINGHADKVGNRRSNLKLSKVRARMTKFYLIEKGVRPNRIFTKGFGDKLLVCSSPCEKNQRVEFIISQKN